MRKVILGAALATMVAGSTVAHAAPAARSASPVEATENLGGGVLWLALLGAGVLTFILFQINDSDDIDLPTSP